MHERGGILQLDKYHKQPLRTTVFSIYRSHVEPFVARSGVKVSSSPVGS